MSASSIELPITDLSGFLGAGRAMIFSRVRANRAGHKATVAVDDMSGVSVGAQLANAGGAALSRVDENLGEMQSGFICGTRRRAHEGRVR